LVDEVTRIVLFAVIAIQSGNGTAYNVVTSPAFKYIKLHSTMEVTLERRAKGNTIKLNTTYLVISGITNEQ
jgi:hypothetical protein